MTTRSAQISHSGEALDRSAAELRSILDATHGLFCVDRDGRTSLCNVACLTMLGFERESDAIGRSVRDLVHHAHPEGSRDPKEDCPIERVARSGGSAHEDGEFFHRRDGTRFPVEYWVRPLQRDGGHDGAVCTFVDIAERRHAEAELQRINAALKQRIDDHNARLLASEALIRTFYNHSSECHAVLVATDQGRFRYEEINPATLRLYGKSREQVIGYTIEDVLGAASAAEITAHLNACLRTDAPYRYERMQGASTVEAVVSPVPAEGGAARRLLVSARDVTERRRLEQELRQAQKMEAVGQLTGGIAHDFNNLLTVILGNTEALRRRFDSGEVPSRHEFDRLAGAASRAAERAASLTHRLLAFSRKQPLAPQTLDANKLIAGMSEMLRRTLGESVAIDVVLAGGLWRVNADPNQLESALLNLSINARDAMPAGGRLTIETCNATLDDSCADEPLDLTPGHYVLITVADTGAGMSAETISRAFEPFFTTKEIGYGTGLGLSMVYGFVKQSGGHVKIDSEVGRGTVVTIYLPRLFEDGAAATAPAAAPRVEAGAKSRRPETILVVEDDALVRDYSLHVVRELGFDALEAGDAVSALRLIDEQPRIALLFTDVGLPGGTTGRQLADEAQRRRPELKILFTTGYARDAIVHDGKLDRGVELVTKPFTMEVLARKILDLLPEA